MATAKKSTPQAPLQTVIESQRFQTMSRLSRSLASMIPVLLAGCASARPGVSEVLAPEEVVRSEARFRKEYIWAPGDQLEVVVRRVPEVSRILIVRPDGYITLPLLDDVHAAGLTPMELKKTLTERFSERLLDPEVTVIAIQVPPPVVYVMGEVANNSSVPLRNAPTAVEAIAFVGGFRKSARPKDTMIIRLGDDGYIRAIPIPAEVDGQPGPTMGMRAMLLQPDDIIFVPEAGRSQVSRFLDEIVNRPLQTLTGLVGLYLNFRLIEVLANQ